MVFADMDSYVHAGADRIFYFTKADRTESSGFAARIENRSAFSDLDIFLSPIYRNGRYCLGRKAIPFAFPKGQ